MGSLIDQARIVTHAVKFSFPNYTPNWNRDKILLVRKENAGMVNHLSLLDGKYLKQELKP